MRQQSAEAQLERGALAERPEVIGTEHIHIRNHDHEVGYDLTLEVIDSDGEVVFEDWYYLQPGEVRSELDALPTGEYEIQATLDNLQEAELRCRLDNDPENTAVIETGNGVLSLTEGLQD